ncbi:MAG: histidinol-phosphate transaminase [Neisseria sp.]|uniref:histidinol-phosphate transaminase n=1 Tax=Neisseria sp. TaxID=192066 RepID=UPI0026DA91E9|nr:histidinol-phosphate transaminase [Neisseria sp.]MDO4640547.1 histidinol-phosphate transaminase [Neisseria sp.]
MNKPFQNIIRSDIRAMTAYAVADVPEGSIKLDAMEMPYRYPENLQTELSNLLAQAPQNLYPNPATSGLPEELRQAFSIPDAAQIVLGNGSDELIQSMTMLVAQQGAKMLALEPSFVMYRHNAQLFGMEYIGVPLKPDFSMDVDAVLEAIAKHQPALVFIAYPNNPTGVCFKREEVEAVLDAASGIVVVDEAYGAFSRDSFLPEAGSCEKLVVMRTLSKIGFAGLRIGYASGHPVVMRELAKIVPPYNMNQLSLTAAKFALQQQSWINGCIDILKRERQRLTLGLTALGMEVFSSEANFVTVRVNDALNVFETLKQNNILIKKLHGTHPLLEQCLRITVGTPEQNDAVLTILKTISLKK